MTAEQDNPAHRIIDDGQQIVDSSRRIMENMHQIYDQAQTQFSLTKAYDDNPFIVLAAALGAGYVLGGGLFTPFSRRLFRIGFRGLILPIAGSQLRQAGGAGLTDEPDFLPGE